jgi:hypothetical protein
LVFLSLGFIFLYLSSYLFFNFGQQLLAIYTINPLLFLMVSMSLFLRWVIMKHKFLLVSILCSFIIFLYLSLHFFSIYQGNEFISNQYDDYQYVNHVDDIFSSNCKLIMYNDIFPYIQYSVRTQVPVIRQENLFFKTNDSTLFKNYPDNPCYLLFIKEYEFTSADAHYSLDFQKNLLDIMLKSRCALLSDTFLIFENKESHLYKLRC